MSVPTLRASLVSFLGGLWVFSGFLPVPRGLETTNPRLQTWINSLLQTLEAVKSGLENSRGCQEGHAMLLRPPVCDA